MRTIIRNNYTPKAGDYHERIIRDESRHKVWFFDCDGIWTDITRIYLAEEFGDSSDIGLTQKFITEQFKVTDEKIDSVREEVGDLSGRVDNVEENLNLEIENRMAADEDLQENIDQVASDLEELKNSPDVVDIVNTKADLDAYDTSKLSENDVVRVLNDETKEGASTYYRWENGVWNYVGMTGPYYTKPQMDELLGGKQDALTAGENITIENNVISATGGTKSVELTQAEYDALTPEEKMNGTVYYITDGQGGGGKTYTGGKGITVDNVNDTISVNGTVRDFTGDIVWEDDPAYYSRYKMTSTQESGDSIFTVDFVDDDTVALGDGYSGAEVILRQTETINDTDWSALWQ